MTDNAANFVKAFKCFGEDLATSADDDPDSDLKKDIKLNDDPDSDLNKDIKLNDEPDFAFPSAAARKCLDIRR